MKDIIKLFLILMHIKVPRKSQNPIIIGQGGQCLNPSWACCWRHPFGKNNYPPFGHSTQNQIFIFALIFLFPAKKKVRDN